MRFVVVGGGVAGVCCAEELCKTDPESQVTIVSYNTVLKASWHGLVRIVGIEYRCTTRTLNHRNCKRSDTETIIVY